MLLLILMLLSIEVDQCQFFFLNLTVIRDPPSSQSYFFLEIDLFSDQLNMVNFALILLGVCNFDTGL